MVGATTIQLWTTCIWVKQARRQHDRLDHPRVGRAQCYGARIRAYLYSCSRSTTLAAVPALQHTFRNEYCLVFLFGDGVGSCLKKACFQTHTSFAN